MGVSGIILLTIGILMLIEGFFVSIWPKTAKKMTSNVNRLRKAGILEIAVAVALIVLGLLIV